MRECRYGKRSFMLGFNEIESNNLSSLFCDLVGWKFRYNCSGSYPTEYATRGIDMLVGNSDQ